MRGTCLLLTLTGTLVSLAAPASAQSLRVFLASEGLTDPNDPNSPITGPPTVATPNVDPTGGPRRLYLWAQLSDTAHTWHGISVSIRVVGDSAITDWSLLDPTFEGPFTRWGYAGQGDLSQDGLLLEDLLGLAVTELTPARGVTGTDGAKDDLHHDASTNSTLLGWIEFDGGDADVFVGIGPNGIARADGAQPPGDAVFFGVGDDADGLRGADFDTFSRLPEARLRACPADIDRDGEVEWDDLLAVLAAWNDAGVPEDVDGDGVVNFNDLLFVLSWWGLCP